MDKSTGFKTQPKTPEIASANRRVKPLARLLLLRYGPTGDSACPLRLGVYYGRKVPFRPVHTARTPLFPHKQPSLRLGPEQSRARSEAKPIP